MDLNINLHIILPSVFENRVLRRIFGPRRYEITGEWRRLNNITFNSGDQIKKTEMDRACSTMGKKRGAYRVLVEKTERRRPTWNNQAQMGGQY